MTNKTKSVLSVILGIASMAGTIGVFATTNHFAPKAKEKLEKLKMKERAEKLSVKQVVKTTWKDYAIPLTLTFLTAGTTCVSTILGRNATLGIATSLGAAYTLYKTRGKEIKNKVTKVFGNEKLKDIFKKLSEDDYEKIKDKYHLEEGEELFWECHIGYFKAKLINVMDAYNQINSKLCTGWQSTYFPEVVNPTLRSFVETASAEVLDPKITMEYLDTIAWSDFYIGDGYGYVYLNMQRYPAENKYGEKFTIICFFEEPCTNLYEVEETNADPKYPKVFENPDISSDGQIDREYPDAGVDCRDPEFKKENK